MLSIALVCGIMTPTARLTETAGLTGILDAASSLPIRALTAPEARYSQTRRCKTGTKTNKEIDIDLLLVILCEVYLA